MEAIELVKKLEVISDRVANAFWDEMRRETEELIDEITPEVIIEYAKARVDYDDFLAQEELTGDEPLFDIASLWVQDFFFADFMDSNLTD